MRVYDACVTEEREEATYLLKCSLQLLSKYGWAIVIEINSLKLSS